MKYINAEELLPKELIEQIQAFITGGYLYIPTNEQKKAWGTNTGIRRELSERNRKIYQKYQQGVRVEDLSAGYCLCKSSIYKIIRKQAEQKENRS